MNEDAGVQETQVTTQVDTNQAEAAAAFTAAVNGTPIEPVQATEEKPAAEEVKEEKPEPEASAPVQEAAPTAPSPVSLTAEELADLRATSQRATEFQTELRKANGRIGALNDQLQQLLKEKKDAGKPATLTPMELKRTREEYPELAGHISSDIAEWLSSQLAVGQDPEAVSALVKQELAKQRAEIAKETVAERQQALEEEHPDARQVINSPDFADWVATLSEKERTTVQTTNSEFVLARKLTAFKAWHTERLTRVQASADAATAAKDQSKKRLEAAVTPQGAGRQSQHVLSEREAAEKAFADAIKS